MSAERGAEVDGETFSWGSNGSLPGTESPLSLGVESRQAIHKAVAKATTAGGVATLLQPEWETRVAAKAVPPTPPE